jgi:XapX domain-containing protein
MKLYLMSLGAGLLVGVIYSLLHVRSPAPPMVALIGLLGILVGEQIIPTAKHLFGEGRRVSFGHWDITKAHVFGHLPGHGRHNAARPDSSASAPPKADG